MVALVSVLGLAVFFVSNQNDGTQLQSKASDSVTITGILESKDANMCVQSYFVGCYTITKGNKTYALVEANRTVKLDSFVGLKVSVVGELAKVTGKNLFLVSSITIAP